MYVLKPICTRIESTVAKATRSMIRNVEEVALNTSGDWCSVIAVSTVVWRMKESEVLRKVVLQGSMEMVGVSVSVGDALLVSVVDIDAVLVGVCEAVMLVANDSVWTREVLIHLVSVMLFVSADAEGSSEMEAVAAEVEEGEGNDSVATNVLDGVRQINVSYRSSICGAAYTLAAET
jgi:hypothetical protein